VTAQRERTASSPLTVMRRDVWSIALVVLVFVSAGLAFSLLRTPMYRAQTSVLIDSTAAVSTNTNPSLPEVSSEEVSTQRLVMQSETVAKMVVDDLGLDLSTTALLDAVTVEPLGDTRVLQVTVSWDNPDTAAEVANGFTKAYLDYRGDLHGIGGRGSHARRCGLFSIEFFTLSHRGPLRGLRLAGRFGVDVLSTRFSSASPPFVELH
jgi:succinoglycan biosynthesis transport protein ExoP